MAMSGLDIALHYLDKLDTELERRIEALEESNERKLDVIHFVKKALEETAGQKHHQPLLPGSEGQCGARRRWPRGSRWRRARLWR